MKRLSYDRLLMAILTSLLLTMSASGAAASGFGLPIDYKQSAIVIARESQVQGWPAGYETYHRSFQDVAVSADGSKIAFWVNVYVAGAWHLYIANADGSGLTDVTPHLPVGWQIGLLDINRDGTKIYGGGGEANWVCDITGPTPACSRAVISGIWVGDGRKPFTINATGLQLFFKHAENSLDKGLYSASLGGVPSKVFDLDTLHCDSECGNMNLLRFLGAARESGRMFFTFDRDYYGKVLPLASTAMYAVSNEGGIAKIADEEHDYVWDQQNINNDVVSADGRRVLYYYLNSGGQPQFYWVEVSTGTKTLIAEVTPNANTTISADGKLVLLSSGSQYRATWVNLETHEERDTGSYFIPGSYDQWVHSGLTGDKRYYYTGAPGASDNYLRKVDMQPTAFSQTPDISAITCSAPALINADGVKVTVTVRVSDAQGLANIDWVNLSVLVEGREQPSWPMGRAPLAFPTGDPGSTRLYDDGTHGDAVAGDGIFTFDGVATRKGDYEGFNTWFNHFTLPHAVGLRVIAKDKNDNYTMADTQLTIAQIVATPETLTLHPGATARSSIFGAGGPYSIQSSDPGVAAARVEGAEVVVTAGHAGTAVLTLSDAGSHLFTLAVRVFGRGTPSVPLLLLLE